MISLTEKQLNIITDYCQNFSDSSLGWYEFEDVMVDNEDVKLANGATKGVFIFPDNDYVFKVELDDNSCQREEEIYEEAEEAGLERFFAKTVLYMIINGVEIYAQPKLITPEDDKDETVDLSPAALELLNSCDDWNGLCENTLFEEFYITYDISLLEQLIDFINNNNINDLHSNNIGYTVKNEPVFIDYGGYQE